MGAIASGGAQLLNEEIVNLYGVTMDEVARVTTSETRELLRRERPAAIVVAVPVAADEPCEAFRDVADDVVCAVTPEPFYAVGLWYDDFSQTTDEEVHDLIGSANAATRTIQDGSGGGRTDASIR